MTCCMEVPVLVAVDIAVPADADVASTPLAEAVGRAETGNERVILTRNGKPVAAVVPLADVAALEAIEDAGDAAAAVAALAEWEAAGRPLGATLDELAKRHGIDLNALEA
jgi:prevent-host-death family protein